MRYNYDGYHYMNGQEPVSWIFMLLIMALIVLAVIWIVKITTRDTKAYQNQALELLKKRLAAGEIDEKEYEQKRKLIE